LVDIYVKIGHIVDINYIPTCEELDLLDELNNFQAVDAIEQEGLSYIAGYVASRFRTKYKTLGSVTGELPPVENDEWISFLSRGKLTIPSPLLLEVTKAMNTIFEKYHGSFISREPWIFKNIAKLTVQNDKFADIPEEVLLCLVRTRTYIRIREINKRLAQKAYCKKQKKKMIKIIGKQKK